MMKKKPINFQIIIFFLLLAVITIFFGYILKPFFMAIFWAALLASIFSPLNRFLKATFHLASLSAVICFIIILIIIIIPAAFVVVFLINESLDIYKSFNSGGSQWLGTIKNITKYFADNPYLGRFDIINEDLLVAKSADIFKGIAGYIFQNLSALTQNTILFLVQFAVMLYTLFYFLRDGEKFMETIAAYFPVDDRHFEMFSYHFLTTAKATLKSTLVIGGIQGILGGLIFYLTGVERALTWGLLMVAVSIVPAIGCSIIWVPAGIIMLFLGHIWQGVVILVFGALVISSVDNLLRPILVGQDTQMHSLLIFLSTLGGISVFGLSGFVLGPLIASFFLASWNLFHDLSRQKEEEAAG